MDHCAKVLFICMLTVSVLVSNKTFAKIKVSTLGVQNSIKEVQRQSEEEKRLYDKASQRRIESFPVSGASAPLLKWKCKTYCTGVLGYRMSACMEDIVYARYNDEAEHKVEDKYYSYCRENYPFYSNGAGTAMADSDCEREW
jgi:hypothetical protein